MINKFNVTFNESEIHRIIEEYYQGLYDDVRIKIVNREFHSSKGKYIGIRVIPGWVSDDILSPEVRISEKAFSNILNSALNNTKYKVIETKYIHNTITYENYDGVCYYKKLKAVSATYKKEQ